MCPEVWCCNLKKLKIRLEVSMILIFLGKISFTSAKMFVKKGGHRLGKSRIKTERVKWFIVGENNKLMHPN